MQDHSFHYVGDIDGFDTFEATLHAGPHTAEGAPLAFVCADGALLCHGCARLNKQSIFAAFAQGRAKDPWRVVACRCADGELCANCDDVIED